MPEVQRVGDLEVSQDLVYQRREWLFERVGWVCLLVVILLGLLGVLGGTGPLNRTEVHSDDGRLRVQYDRFLRCNAPAQLHLHVTGTEKPTRVWLDHDYLEGLRLREVSPRPLHVETEPGRHVLVFQIRGPATIVLRVEPEYLGRLTGRAGVGDEKVVFGQFVYP